MINLTPQSIDDKALYNSIAAKKHKKKEAPQQKKGGILWAVIAIIELIAIGGILAWWASWVL